MSGTETCQLADQDQVEWCKVERCAGSDRLVIVFSHINEKPGRFSFYGTFRDIAVNKLFVNTPANCWYRDGIPGVGDCIESVADGIRIVMQELTPRSVMCVGNSMGAYAALLFGTLVNADQVLAIGPETLLNLPGSRSRAYIGSRPPSPYDDLLPYLSQPVADRRTDIIIGESDVVDVRCAQRIAHLPGVRVRSLRGVGHEVPAMLHRFDVWKPLVEGYVRDGALPPLMPLEGRLFSSGDAAEALVEGRRLRVGGMMKEARASLRRCLDLYPDADAAHDDLGMIEQHEGSFIKAEAAHRRALRVAPDRAIYHLHLGTALARQGRDEEAEATLAAALSDASCSAAVHHQLGLLYAGQGRHGRAEAAQRAAIATAPRHANFHFHLALALDAQGRFEEALEAYGQACSLNPGSPELIRRLADAQRRSAAGAGAPEVDRRCAWGDSGVFTPAR
jgi:Flp pilus assembly protein TadD